MNGLLNVGGDTTLDGELYVGSLAEFDDDVSMNGLLNVGGDTTLDGELYVGSLAEFDDDVSMNGLLIVGGDTTLDGELYVGSLAEFDNDVSMNGLLIVGGDTTLDGELYVGSLAEFDNDVSMNGLLNVGGDTTLDGELYVGSLAEFDDDVSMNGLLIVGGDTTLDGELYVGSLAEFDDDVSMNGNLSIGKDLIVNGKLNVKQYTTNLTIYTVSYELIIAQDVSLNGRLFLNGDASLNKRLILGGDASFNSRLFLQTDSLYVGGNLFTGGSNYFTGDVSMTDNLRVVGDISLNKRLILGGDASMNGNLTVKNLTVTGNVSGIATSTATTTTDSWLLTNLINSPAAVTYNSSTTYVSSSTLIYIPWTYPTQINVGFTSSYLPLISSLTVSYSGSNSSNTTTYTGNIITNATSYSASVGSLTNSYINNFSLLTNPSTSIYSSTNSTSYGCMPLTGIVLSKTTGTVTSGTTSITTGTICALPFPQDNNGNTTGTTYRNAYVYYDENLSSLASDTYASALNVYYKNNSTTYNSSYASFYGFLSSGVPGVPLTPTYSSNSSTSIAFSYSAPTYGDINNTGTTTAIQNYLITYTPVSNNIRYGGLYASTASTSTTTSAGSNTLTSLYPDTSYNIIIQARNANNTNYGSSTSVYNTTVSSTAYPGTSYISPFYSAFNSVSWSWSGGTTKTARSVKDTSSSTANNTVNAVSDVLYGTSASWSASNFIIPVHTLSNRGSASTSTIMSLSSSLTWGGGSSVSGATATYKGFPASTSPSTTTGNSMTISTAVSDYYTGNTSGYSGYYLHATSTFTIPASVFTTNGASGNSSTISLTASSSAGTSLTTTSTFYYESYSGTTPSIGTFIINKLYTSTLPISTYNSSSHTVANYNVALVSGVYVLYSSSIYVDVSCTNMGNIGTYFYTNGNIVTYSNVNSGLSVSSNSETNLYNLSTGSNVTFGTTNKIFGTIGFTRSLPLSISSGYYGTSIGLSAQAKDFYGNTVTATATSISTIYDYPSVTLLYSTFANTPQTVTSSNTTAYRLFSGYTNSETTQTITGILPSTSYGTSYAVSYSIPYDNSWNIYTKATIDTSNATEELQVVNGYFITKTFATTYPSYYGYANYSSYRYGCSTITGSSFTNSADYSSITTITPSYGYRFATFCWKLDTSAYSKFKIVITFNSNTPPYLKPADSCLYPDSGYTKLIYVHYKLENSSNTTLASTNGITTSWVDANSNSSSAFSSSSWYKTDNVYNGKSTMSVSSNVATITALFQGTLTTLVANTTTYLYVRIGLPMSISTAINNVQLAYTT
jgi:cytoskeletal protein CcmA (bactofilin family)